MKNAITELQDIIHELDNIASRAKENKVEETLKVVEEAVHRINRSSSRSWLGYQANVYYKNFAVPPADAEFSISGGLEYGSETVGNWEKYNEEKVQKKIFENTGCSSMVDLEEIAIEARKIFEDSQGNVLSILSLVLRGKADAHLQKLQQEIEEMSIIYLGDIIKSMAPSSILSNDDLALAQGRWVPPHKAIEGQVVAIRHAFVNCDTLVRRIRRILLHLERQVWYPHTIQQTGTRVFIGHGRSPLWMEVKMFLQDRLGLACDEFNRVPIAGKTTIERLSTMLDAAVGGIIVMTAEDEQPDATVRARMNVIHEVGLIQGRLGFDKAIVMLEEGCEEFSNIQGWGQIRFPKGNIRAAFEEVRRALEERGVLHP